MDPVDAIYRANGRQAIIRVPIHKCLHLKWLASPCDVEGNSPFVRTLLEYESKVCRTYLGSQLERFYATFQPSNAASVMGIKEPQNAALRAASATGAPWFWYTGNIDSIERHHLRTILDENIEHGGFFGHVDGDKYFGPVSDRKGQLEFNRLTQLFMYIKQKGFRVDRFGYGNIRGMCLRRSALYGDNRIVIVSGHHRAAVLTALGYDHIDLQLLPGGTGGTIQRSDARCWPVVIEGHLTEDEALQVFDRVFVGKPPYSFSSQTMHSVEGNANQTTRPNGETY